MISPCWRRSSGTSPTPAAIAAGRRARRAAAARRPSTVPASAAVDAEDRPRDLAPPGADEPGERDDLAGAHVEGDVREDALARQALDLAARRVAALGLLLREERVHVAPDHRADDRRGRELLDRLRQHVPAVAHDGDALAEREDLLEPVRDEEHGRAARRAACSAMPKSRSTSVMVSAAVGSSITITRASAVSAFAISTSCWSAIESPRAEPVGVDAHAELVEERGRVAAHPAAVDAVAGA